MKTSVIIPTYNRADILKQCLERLIQQEGVDYEIIVVDDGSEDHTKEVATSFEEVKYIHQANAHQGVARNRGVLDAKGELLIFLADDIFVEPDFVATHVEAHQKHNAENVVVLGLMSWDPAIEINDYMKFLDRSGWQFGYDFLQPGFVEKEPYKYFYTSNISMRKTFFNKEKFDHHFTVYGWEDIELGYRLYKNHDMKLWYEPTASGLHHQVILEKDLPKKMNNIGKSAVHFEKLQPEINVIPKGLKKLVIKTVCNSLTLPLTKLLGKNFYFKCKSWNEFFKGVKSA